MNFVNLYIQSEYSMLSSSISINELMNFSREDNQKMLAICDSNMHGAFKFYQACKKNNKKAILGLKLKLSESLEESFLLVYAKNYDGYLALLQLATMQAEKKALELKDIALYQKDLFVVIPSIEHELIVAVLNENYEHATKLINLYNTFFSTYYLGLDMQSTLMINNFSRIYAYFKKLNMPMLALMRANFIAKEDYIIYQTLRAIDLAVNNYTLSDKEQKMYLIKQVEAEELFQNYPDLINNTNYLANHCHVDIQTNIYRLPTYGMENTKEYLANLCKVGLNKRLKNRRVNVALYRKRLLYELTIIDKMGYNDYFLIVYDYVKYAKLNNILVGAGRGSAPGSLVIYALGITEVDPIEYDLLFERFLNPERISMPDIDVDFPDDKREEVINYIAKRFGKERVAYITTFGTFGSRMALRDVARIMQISERRMQGVMKPVIEANLPLKELIEENEEIKMMMDGDAEIAKLYYLASKLEGLPRHTSTHAAGIIMADGDLIQYTALQKGLGDLWQSQYEASDLEALGLVKMDILGLRNLSIIKKVLDKIYENTNQTINIYKIPLNDPLVYKLIASGDTDGVFQLESRGMKKLLVDLKTSSFMDIVNANALFRPGPMEMIPTFIRRKFGEKVHYLHEDLVDILKPTYGTIVFQEQIILIAERIAGYTLGMADLLRRAVSKKDHKVLEEERTRFVNSAAKQGISNNLSNEIYDYIVKFANYGFNKSHSVAYAMIAYQMAYLKTHYYTYFMAVLMTNSIGSVSATQSYIADCRKHNLEIMLPSINISTTEFVVKDNRLYYPLTGIANIGHTIANEIINNRESGNYQNFNDFVLRTSQFLNKRQVSYLIYAGALDEFSLSRREMIENYEFSLLKKNYALVLGPRIIENVQKFDEYSFDEITVLEKEALGFNLKYNLLIKYQSFKKKHRTTNISDLNQGENVRLVFIISSFRTIKTKNNEPMAFIEIYDDSGSIDGVIFTSAYKNLTVSLENGFVYYGEGRVDKRGEKLQVIFNLITNVK